MAGDDGLKSSLQSVVLLLNWSIAIVFWVITLWQVKCIWYVQYRIMIRVQKRGRVLFGKLWKKKKNKNNKNKLVILSKGSMVRRNLHHKISHKIENYLQWENVSLSEVLLCVNCQFDRMCGLTSVYAKCPFHDFFFLLHVFFVRGKQVGVRVGTLSLLCSSPFRRPQRTLCFLMMSKIKNSKDNIHASLRMASSP